MIFELIQSICVLLKCCLYITVGLVLGGHRLMQTPNQPRRKSHVPTDFCTFNLTLLL